MDLMGVITDFAGVLCHDHWKPYLGYGCYHALCNTHHVRELQWVIDFKGHCKNFNLHHVYPRKHPPPRTSVLRNTARRAIIPQRIKG